MSATRISPKIEESTCAQCRRPECVVSCRARELAMLVFEREPMPIGAVEEVAHLLVDEESRCHVPPGHRSTEG